LRILLTRVIGVKRERRNILQKLGMLSRCDLSVDFLTPYILVFFQL